MAQPDVRPGVDGRGPTGVGEARRLPRTHVPVENWRQALVQTEGIPPYLIEHLCHVAETHKHGEQDRVTDVVETTGGTPPKTLETFIRDNRAAFEPGTP
ncbi:MAG TPA: hypothetical protein VGN37_26250 [Actinocatenispora sp.]